MLIGRKQKERGHSPPFFYNEVRHKRLLLISWNITHFSFHHSFLVSRDLYYLQYTQKSVNELGAKRLRCNCRGLIAECAIVECFASSLPTSNPTRSQLAPNFAPNSLPTSPPTRPQLRTQLAPNFEPNSLPTSNPTSPPTSNPTHQQLAHQFVNNSRWFTNI